MALYVYKQTVGMLYDSNDFEEWIESRSIRGSSRCIEAAERRFGDRLDEKIVEEII